LTQINGGRELSSSKNRDVLKQRDKI